MANSMDREPCPDRTIDDLGGAFAMGAIGGSIFHLFKGAINAPRGDRLTTGLQTMRMNAPRTAGSFAVWGGLFSAFDCAMVYARQKEDPWNSILAGAATGATLSLRQGFRAAARSALFSSAIVALVEGYIIAARPVTDPPKYDNVGYDYEHNAEAEAEAEAKAKGWLGGMLWRRGKSGDDDGDGRRRKESETKILESFDDNTPTPMPTFEIH